MRDFDTILEPRTTTVVQQAAAPEVTETVRVVPASGGTGYLAKEPGLWNWTDLRDYITVEIEKRHGAQVRDPLKESGICKGFIARHGIEQAVRIAQAAFEVHDGMWRNAPISITRFCKGSDPYFAAPIAANL